MKLKFTSRYSTKGKKNVASAWTLLNRFRTSGIWTTSSSLFILETKLSLELPSCNVNQFSFSSHPTFFHVDMWKTDSDKFRSRINIRKIRKHEWEERAKNRDSKRKIKEKKKKNWTKTKKFYKHNECEKKVHFYEGLRLLNFKGKSKK